MSEATLNQEQVPKEVAEVWAQLHAEARENYEELAPHVNLTIMWVVLVAAVAMLGVGVWSANRFYFQPREVERLATATAQAIAGSEKLARTATAEARVGSEELAKTATAQAVAANATATVQEKAVNATATAQAELANATATAQAIERERTRCRDQRYYSMTISSEPSLQPNKSYTWLTNRARPGMVATWIVTNTGSCAWEVVALKPISGGEAESVEVKRDGEPLALNAQGYLSPSVVPSQTVEIELRSRSFDPWQAQEVEGEWILVANDLSLFDLPHFRVEVKDWVIAVSPTPTPIPPTLTPTPICVQVCREVCDTCTRKVEDPVTGETKVEKYKCNCHPECHIECRE